MSRVIRCENKVVYSYLPLVQKSEMPRLTEEFQIGKHEPVVYSSLKDLPTDAREILNGLISGEIWITDYDGMTLEMNDIPKMEQILTDKNFEEVRKQNDEMAKTLKPFNKEDFKAWEKFYNETDFLFMCMIKNLINFMKRTNEDTGKETFYYLSDRVS